MFLARFITFVRVVTPGLAGMSGLRYRTFLFWNVLGGLCWGIGYTLLGYVVGVSIEHLLSQIGLWFAAVVVVAEETGSATSLAPSPPVTGVTSNSVVPVEPVVVLVMVMLAVGVNVSVNVHSIDSLLVVTTTVWVTTPPTGVAGVWGMPLQSKAVTAQLPAPVAGGTISETR